MKRKLSRRSVKSATKKADKVIHRELAAVLTAGTLVDTGMLQSDMSTYCMAIKEIDRDNLPAFGVAFVDTASAQSSSAKSMMTST
jgi:DNA mismatch repair protein MSH6